MKLGFSFIGTKKKNLCLQYVTHLRIAARNSDILSFRKKYENHKDKPVEKINQWIFKYKNSKHEILKMFPL